MSGLRKKRGFFLRKRLGISRVAWAYQTRRPKRRSPLRFPEFHREVARFLAKKFDGDTPLNPSDGEIARTEEMLRVEAVLFLSREPIGAKKLAQFARIENSDDVRQIVRQLRHLYDQNHYAFRIMEFAGGFQFRTRPQFTPWLRRLCRTGGVENQELPEIRLSPAAMVTLAIIAYKQPIIRAKIEAIRGGACAEILRQLLSKDLIRIAGRSTELGRPRLYKTTRKFLEVFGLKSLSQLPGRLPGDTEE